MKHDLQAVFPGILGNMLCKGALRQYGNCEVAVEPDKFSGQSPVIANVIDNERNSGESGMCRWIRLFFRCCRGWALLRIDFKRGFDFRAGLPFVGQGDPDSGLAALK